MAAGGQDLWRQAASWLTRCGVLHRGHKSNWDSSSIHDLAYTLRDGVLLCNLLNVLQPGCIDMKEVNQRPQLAQFLCMRNINLFLRVCDEVFEVPKEDLFDPLMLFDLSNFHMVLCTLARLSQCPKALAKERESFSAFQTRPEEAVYKDLHVVSAVLLATPRRFECKRHLNPPARRERQTIPSIVLENEELEINEDFCYVTINHKQPEPVSSLQSIEKRDYVIRELVDTECNYVEVLTKIVHNFMKPLTPVMKEEDMKLIFFGILELHDIHTELLLGIRLATDTCVPPPGTPRLADVFLGIRQKLLIYGDYCSNLTAAQETLKNLEARDPVIRNMLVQLQKEHSNCRIQLRDILSVPMQRVLKYHLLLDKLHHETLPNHEEYKMLERAKDAMVDVAQYINEVKRDSEVLALLSKVQESITDWNDAEFGANGKDLSVFGRLLLDGELKVKCHEDQKLRSRYVFVFDKLILMCKPVKENQYSFRAGIRLAEYRVQEGSTRRTLRSDARWSSHFHLVRRTKDSTFTLYARNEDSRSKWAKAIRDAIDNLEPLGCRNTTHKFVMHSFDRPATCSCCSKFLKGRIFQGYICTVCKVPVHKECISSSGRCQGQRASTPPPPLPPHNPNPDKDLHYYMWYVGEMDRDMATSRLDRRVDGTFLLRVRPQPNQNHTEFDTHLALSLKTDNTVKHMRVCCKPIDQVPHYFLSETRYFRSVVELITYYEKTSLAENFVGLNSVLRWPFRRVIVIVVHDYRPVDDSQMSLRPGTKLLVLSKEGDGRGWWKGRVLDKGDNRVGYFPKECVRQESITPKLLG